MNCYLIELFDVSANSQLDFNFHDSYISVIHNNCTDAINVPLVNVWMLEENPIQGLRIVVTVQTLTHIGEQEKEDR